MAGTESGLAAVRVIYTGNVQGVGFRFSALEVSRRFDVDGYVRNLPDGAVELVALGEAAQIEQFLDDVAHRMRSHIEQARREDISPTRGEFPSPFQIRL
jgi:acylphosphatase